ncbi:MAG: efflux RND transporter periplasmic adaptor subunit [Elusimicrobia bacterium]|nr:efflux RND transporter periplasmic adaptor subunit [Elusimicrobiota bacterium]
MSKKKIIWLVVGVLVLGGMGMAWKKYKSKQSKKEDWVQVTKGNLVVKFQEVGELEPKVKIDVKSNVTGRITKLVVEEGDEVKKGQLLAVVQPGQTAAERYLPYEVRAPMAGTVIKRKVEVGDSVVSGLAEFGAGTVLITIGDLSRMVVKLDVNEVDIPKLSLHQNADIHLDAFPAETFKGEITFIGPLAELNDQKIKIFRTKVEIPKADPRLRPGMTARIEVVLAQHADVVKAPIEAIFEEGDKNVAYVVADNPKLPPVKRFLKTGLKDEVDIEILNGLKVGEKLSLSKPEEKKNAQSS